MGSLSASEAGVRGWVLYLLHHPVDLTGQLIDVSSQLFDARLAGLLENVEVVCDAEEVRLGGLHLARHVVEQVQTRLVRSDISKFVEGRNLHAGCVTGVPARVQEVS